MHSILYNYATTQPCAGSVYKIQTTEAIEQIFFYRYRPMGKYCYSRLMTDTMIPTAG